ncbi:LysR family transcriptional regulator [Caulobacter endophyticus]|uniref:LysR family transcriptional regulator n=1 Tax=Caulobacter endophyticus TaxID=2172652 RepID=A0A2T9KA22_9CAUL|nr:LysR family transcriptional regulator [Caulobacter endophyticus]PVM92713.1 LysR family transcriptional regulator [Caulobacter endophyticus]
MELLADMALFVEVMKTRSFRRAAEALHMPSSTLSRRIGMLEKAVGLRLLNRTTRKVEPTEAGQLYYERCRRIVDEARLAHEQLGELLEQPSGTLRVSLPVDFGTYFLTPVIAEFAEKYPAISFEFDLTPRRVDLVAEPFDVAIRMGELSDSGLIARRLATVGRSLYASPAYLDRRGAPKAPADLIDHECLCTPRIDHWSLSSGGDVVEVLTHGRFRLNSIGMIRRLATMGMGIGLLADGIVSEDVERGDLCRVLPEWSAAPISVYAITETRLLPAKTQRFIEYLQACLDR